MNSPPVDFAAPQSILTLRGAKALSSFRLEKLLAVLKATQSGIRSVECTFVHFVEPTHALSTRERDVLEKLLTYGGPVESIGKGALFLVIPRLGTISPWASKATDIAHNCGLRCIKRIERGTLFFVESDGILNDVARESIMRAIHDPMTETVRSTLADANEMFVA